jgi:hypothetical protein
MSCQLGILLVAAYFMATQGVNHSENALSVTLACLTLAAGLLPALTGIVLFLRGHHASNDVGETCADIAIDSEGAADEDNPVFESEGAPTSE